jgi:hypothetical protein
MKYIFLFFCFSLFFACQNAQQNEASTEAQSTAGQTDGFMKDRPTGQQNWNWTFLTNQIFHYRAGVTVGEEPGTTDYKGLWIDFEPDGTFEKGKYDKTSYTGMWAYDHDKSELTLYPDPKTEKNSQWLLKYNDDIVIMIGTAKYGDNATQIQLVRKTDKPTKD